MKRVIVVLGIFCALCSGVAAAASTTSVLAGGVCINEILIDPNSSSYNFDSDGNGTADTLDEFVEIYNLSGSTIDISGWQLWDAGTIANWFTFPAGTTLGPGNYAVVIDAVQAGGSLPPVSGGNLAFAAGHSIGILSNGGDNVVLYDPGADEYVQLTYLSDTVDDPTSYAGFSSTATRVGSAESWGNDTDGVSLTRYPAGDTTVVVHNTVSPENASPGGTGGGSGSGPIINELVAEHAGSDVYEYLEVFGTPSSDLSSLSILQVEGDSEDGPGLIASVTPVGQTDAEGIWVSAFLDHVLNDGTITLLLVDSFSGSVGADLDTNDDGSLDSTPWTTLLDDVSVSDEGASDRSYSSVILTKAMAGGVYPPGGASRIPNGTDTDSVGDWVVNDFDGAGLPGYPDSTLDAGEAYNTPGELNTTEAPPVPTSALLINEWVSDHTGTDTHEFVEVVGEPLASWSSATILVVDGDTGGEGTIDAVYPVGTLNGGGYWDTGYTGDVLAGSLSLLLVTGFSGAANDDLDSDDDGVIDVTPWTELLDDVAVLDGDPGDVAYSASVLGVGGASRIPNGTDTDSAADWLVNDFDGAGLPGFTGSIGLGEAYNTARMPNRVSVEQYYSTVISTSQSELRTTLHETIDDHIRYEYTADAWDTWNVINAADEFPVGADSILDIYRNEVYTKISGGTGVYNREHSWPNTYGFSSNNEGNYPYTDCHHLFASDTTYNGDRSSRPFRSCDASCSEDATVANNGQGGGSGVYPGNSNWYDGDVTGPNGRWETWIGRRGDVARALLYMDVRYEGGVHGVSGYNEPDLQLTDTLSLVTSGAPYMGELSTLLQWHEDDPVDDVERRRNEVVYSYQTNRNPFIDHPEWVECLFLGTGCVPEPVFSDGFESGDTSQWSVTVQ